MAREGLQINNNQLLIIYDYNYWLKLASSAASNVYSGSSHINDIQGNTQQVQDAPIVQDDQRSKFFRFWINPDKLKDTRKKKVTSVYTRAGWENIYWQRSNEMYLLAYSGKSGVLYDSEDIVSLESYDITQSKAWITMNDCKHFFDSAVNDLMLVFKGEEHKGYFDNFVFDRDAKDPLIINYSFLFKAYPTDEWKAA